MQDRSLLGLPHASPLDAGGLRAIDDCLDAGKLDEAQQLLAAVGVNPEHEHGVTYLATRLLYLRERLDPESVVVRLRELLQHEPAFPEASALLQLAEAGIAGSRSLAAMKAVAPAKASELESAEEAPDSDRPTLPHEPVGAFMPRPVPRPKPATAQVPRPSSIAPNTTPLPRPERSRHIWPKVEVSLYEGQRKPASDYLQRDARMPQTPTDLGQLATRAAELLSRSWITHHFAPFDQSLHSLARLELALEVIYGGERLPGLVAEAEHLSLLLGAYLGETLRTSHRGRWEGTPSQPKSLQVRAGSHDWQPFSIIEDYLISGGQPSLRERLQPGIARPGTQAWLSYVKPIEDVPELWSQPPTAEYMPVLGAAMCHSVYSLACRQRTGAALDRSEESLDALDDLLDSLVTSAAPLSGNEAWLSRLSVLVGAYTGEVLRMQSGGEWQVSDAPSLSQRYFLRLPNGIEATPAENLVARAVAKKNSQLRDYVRAILRRVSRKDEDPHVHH